jgi:hypothetical protein
MQPCGERLEPTKLAKRHGRQRREVEEACVDLPEELLGHLEVPDQKGVLVGRAQLRRPLAVEVDQRVVPERLEEDCRAVVLQHPADLPVSLSDVHVVDDPLPAYEVEGAVLELQVLAVHRFEGGPIGDPFASRGLPGAFHRDGGDVDAGHLGAMAGEEERVAAGPAAVLEHPAAGCELAQLTLVEIVRTAGCRVELRGLTAHVIPTRVEAVVELLLAFLPGGGRH